MRPRMAELNGIALGAAWKNPRVLSCKSALRRGPNTLRIVVANLWIHKVVNSPPWTGSWLLRPMGTLGRTGCCRASRDAASGYSACPARAVQALVRELGGIGLPACAFLAYCKNRLLTRAVGNGVARSGGDLRLCITGMNAYSTGRSWLVRPMRTLGRTGCCRCLARCALQFARTGPARAGTSVGI